MSTPASSDLIEPYHPHSRIVVPVVPGKPTSLVLDKSSRLNVSNVDGWVAEVSDGKEAFQPVVSVRNLQHEMDERSGFISPENIIFSTLIFGIVGTVLSITVGHVAPEAVHGSTEFAKILVLGGALGVPVVGVSSVLGRLNHRFNAVKRFARRAAQAQQVGLYAWMRSRYGLAVSADVMADLSQRVFFAPSFSRLDFQDVSGRTWALKHEGSNEWVVVQYGVTETLPDGGTTTPIFEATLRKNARSGVIPAASSGSVPALKSSANKAEEVLPKKVRTLQGRVEEMVVSLLSVSLTVEQQHVVSRAKVDADSVIDTYLNLRKVRSSTSDSVSQLVKVLSGLIQELEAVQNTVAEGFENSLQVQTAYVASRGHGGY